MVQIITESGVVSASRPSARSSASRSAAGYFTYTDGDVWSWYSTSASASAVWQLAHQYTGLRPRYTMPFSMIVASSSTMVCS